MKKPLFALFGLFALFSAGAVTLERADTARVRAWQGERVGIRVNALSAQADAEAGMPLTPVLDLDLPSTAGWLGEVLTDDFRACGTHPDTLAAYGVYDVILPRDSAVALLPGQQRPLWVTVEVPRSASAAGTHRGVLRLADPQGRAVASLPLTLEVADRSLPQPQEQAFFLDLWQQPYSVSRYYGVEPWSAEHTALLRPYLEMMARAGQRTISAILFYEPWGEQSRDKFLPMVETTLKKDGTWHYDYSVLDRWVELNDSCGVGPWIECYSMIPWQMSFRYFDEAKGDYATLTTTADSPEYRALWLPFLQSLGRHMREKGWFDRTVLAMDERGVKDILQAYHLAQEAAPGIKVGLAGSYHPELADLMQLYSLTASHEAFPPDVLARRKEAGQVSTLYTCCSSPAPNLFSNSEPADAAFLPLYCTATGTDGYLHWSFMNWTDDPLADSRFFLFAPGDTYFIYPGPLSSVRYENLVGGIQLAEKVRRLLASPDLSPDDRAALRAALAPIAAGVLTPAVTTASLVANLRATVADL